MKCRHCGTELKNVFIDLNTSPPSNSYISKSNLNGPETYFPLRVLTCETCWLLQTEDYADADELFTEEYAYFSSVSSSWLAHSEKYANDMTKRFNLNKDSLVSEIAANDGYLLQYFKKLDIPCYGVEPTTSTAEAAREKGIEIVEDFFGVELATKLRGETKQVDLVAANNVLAHVPDINDFVSGFRVLLKKNGVATFEFPHLYQLVDKNQFDTIYHEHYSYLSLGTVSEILTKCGLEAFDVQEIPTHGGSLRVFAQRKDTGQHPVTDAVKDLLKFEADAGMKTVEFYNNFQGKAQKIKRTFLSYLLDCKAQGLKVAAYGAAAKGNTLMNYAGVTDDLLPYVVDRNPNKQGMFMPGSRIEIVDEDHMKRDRPDRIIILPWNLAPEISAQLEYIKDWNGVCVRFVPELEELKSN